MYYYRYERLKKLASTEKGKEYVRYLQDYYQTNYANNPIFALKYSYAKLYDLDGDRVKFQGMYFERRKRLMVLQVLAISDDKYIEDLEDVISAICDEITWVVPAHTYDTIDLFSAETAMYLAETLYVMGDRISKELHNRVRESIQRKIVDLYEGKSFSWEEFRNNWVAVCACGIGLAYLYLFPERFCLVKERILSTINGYKNTLDLDGYCSEGYSYWAYGFGFFCLFYDVYEQLTGEHLPVLDDEFVKKSLLYGQNAVLSDNVYLPFADGGSKGEHDEAIILCTIERMFSVNLFIDEKELFMPSNQALGYRVLDTINRNYTKKDSRIQTAFYKESQVFIRQNGSYIFTVKGGHNAEAHNHNDIGAFSIIRNAKQYIADIGVGEYRRQTFGSNEERYKQFPCSSLSHSVPIVDGQSQWFGREYYGEVVKQEDSSITLNITKAYKNISSKLIVEYQTKPNGVDVSYNCENIQEKIVFRFVSFIEPKWRDNAVCIEDMFIYDNLGVKPTISKQNYAKYLGEPGVAYTIDYDIEKTGSVVSKFEFRFV